MDMGNQTVDGHQKVRATCFHTQPDKHVRGGFYSWAVQYSIVKSLHLHVSGCIQAQESFGYFTIHAEHQANALAIPCVV